MRPWKALLVIVALALFWVVLLIWAATAQGAPAPERMADGFVKLLKNEGTGAWYDCGSPTPRGEWVPRAKEIADELLDALDENGVRSSPWEAWAIIFKESRGNRCAIGPNPRKAARALGLVDKDWRTWTEADVLAVVESPRWGRRSADLGLGQVVWKKFARIRDRGVVRVPTAREMVSIDAGTRVVAWSLRSREFYQRAKQFAGKPSAFWRGSVPSVGYATEISRLARAMGAPSL